MCISDLHWKPAASSYFEVTTINSGISLLSRIETLNGPSAVAAPAAAPRPSDFTHGLAAFGGTVGVTVAADFSAAEDAPSTRVDDVPTAAGVTGAGLPVGEVPVEDETSTPATVSDDALVGAPLSAVVSGRWVTGDESDPGELGVCADSSPAGASSCLCVRAWSCC